MRDIKKKEEKKKNKMHSCENAEICPVEGKCLTKSAVYNAEVKIVGRKKLTRYEKRNLDALENLESRRKEEFKPKEKEYYTGLTEGTLKDRMYKRHFDFRHKNFSKRTTLSKYIWKLKEHYFNFEVKWKILSVAKSYNPASKSCNLCTKENIIYFLGLKQQLGMRRMRS